MQHIEIFKNKKYFCIIYNLIKCFNNINPLTSPGEVVIVFTYPYLSAGAPELGEVKGLIVLKLK